MRIRREDGLMIMTEMLVCPNHGDMNHFNNTFTKISEYEYECPCGVVMRITRIPILVIDKYGRLNVQVVAEPRNADN